MKYISLIIILLFFACNEKKKSNNTEKQAYADFLKTFKTITIDNNLKVFSEYNGNQEYGFYNGIALDSSAIALLPEEIQESQGYGTYACYKFNIDSNTLGLIARTASTYDASSLKLLLFNTKENKILDYVELADLVGDAGALLTIKSWIIKNADGNLSALIWKNVTEDRSVEDATDSTITSINSYKLINVSNGLKIINQDSVELNEQFSRFLGKETK